MGWVLARVLLESALLSVSESQSVSAHQPACVCGSQSHLLMPRRWVQVAALNLFYTLLRAKSEMQLRWLCIALTVLRLRYGVLREALAARGY